ncbi:MAG: hypothetical protein IPK35_08415 [Saprospiraceae bacterium]|jgi:hypothetical protein|nr:hypothetical protein [Saprospiraceae bacterium]
MRQVTIYTTDKEYSHFIELAKNLHYVKKIETDEEPSKTLLINEIKEAVDNLALARKGKLKLKSARELYNEL